MDLVKQLNFHLKIQRIFGLAPYKVNKKRKFVTSFLTNFYFLVNVITSTVITLMSLTLAKSAANMLTDQELTSNGTNLLEVSNISEYIQRIFAITTYGVILLFAMFKKYQHMELMSCIVQSEAMILRNFSSEVSADLNAKFNLKIHLGLFLYVSFASVINYANLLYIKSSLKDIIRVGTYAALTLTTYLFSCHYQLMCALITKRFKLVETICGKPLSLEQFSKMLELNKILRNCLFLLNDSQGFQLFLNLTSDTILITIQVFLTLYTIFLPKGSGFVKDNVIQNVCWTAPLVFKMLMVIFAGEYLKSQIEDTNKAISDNYHRRFNGKESEILLGCPMDKLYGEELSCSAAEFFVVDFTLIYNIVASVTTYLVILLQFQVDAEGDE